MLAMARRHLMDWHWLVFFGGILAAWGALFAMQIPADLREMADIYGSDFWAQICRIAPGIAGYPAVFAMWAIMSAAMMAPTFVPALSTYDDITGSTDDRGGFAALLAGYGAIWLGFSALAAAAQVALSLGGMVNPVGQSTSALLSAGLLVLAGLYQFSSFKEACLSQCMAPMMFFLRHWTPGRRAAFSMGLRLGALCLGCCWALMLLAFVGGTMSVAWMGLATLIMVLEKLPQVSRFVVRPVGVMLVLLGATLGAGTLI